MKRYRTTIYVDVWVEDNEGIEEATEKVSEIVIETPNAFSGYDTEMI